MLVLAVLRPWTSTAYRKEEAAETRRDDKEEKETKDEKETKEEKERAKEEEKEREKGEPTHPRRSPSRGTATTAESGDTRRQTAGASPGTRGNPRATPKEGLAAAEAADPREPEAEAPPPSRKQKTTDTSRRRSRPPSS